MFCSISCSVFFTSSLSCSFFTCLLLVSPFLLLLVFLLHSFFVPCFCFTHPSLFLLHFPTSLPVFFSCSLFLLHSCYSYNPNNTSPLLLFPFCSAPPLSPVPVWFLRFMFLLYPSSCQLFGLHFCCFLFLLHSFRSSNSSPHFLFLFSSLSSCYLILL